MEWLYGFADQERGVGWNPASSADEQWKLGRMRALLDLAGAPDRGMTCVLVAGSKGKGSTAVFLASILHRAGVRTGLYTKPHLQTYRERIRLDGVAISPAEFAIEVARAQRMVERLRAEYPEAGAPTTFEVTTALAIRFFARNACQVAVLEVGLGGRLDATNAVEPTLSVITPISHDHTPILGRTLGAIATEKAGILRRGMSAVISPQPRSAREAIQRACERLGARCTFVSRSGRGLAGITVPLAGAHQRVNAATAVAAARVLAAEGLGISEAAIREGIGRVSWPGRFEVHRLPEGKTVVLDGAHNDGSAAALAETLRSAVGQSRLHLVIGINRDKDAAAILRPLLALASSVHTARAASSARALGAEPLAALVQRRRDLPVKPWASVPEALAAAQEAAAPSDWVCVTGSLAVVGEARTALGLPPPESVMGDLDRAGQLTPDGRRAYAARDD